jgi:hypothetical protein
MIAARSGIRPRNVPTQRIIARIANASVGFIKRAYAAVAAQAARDARCRPPHQAIDPQAQKRIRAWPRKSGTIRVAAPVTCGDRDERCPRAYETATADRAPHPANERSS